MGVSVSSLRMNRLMDEKKRERYCLAAPRKDCESDGWTIEDIIFFSFTSHTCFHRRDEKGSSRESTRGEWFGVVIP